MLLTESKLGFRLGGTAKEFRRVLDPGTRQLLPGRIRVIAGSGYLWAQTDLYLLRIFPRASSSLVPCPVFTALQYAAGPSAVSYTHLTLPTKRIV